MGKPLTQIVPDFREALEEGVQQATKTVVRDLQIAGPYWTGFFSDVWQVNVGKTAIKANIKNPLEVPKQPKTPQYVDIDVPESPDLQGYTIGNRSEYRLLAMDIVKDRRDPPRGRSAANARLTADKKWYDKYINAEMPRVIDQQITNVFRRFK
jgi:hypothetical protein